MNDLSYIIYCAETQELINQMQSSVDKLMKPLVTDDDVLPHLYKLLSERLSSVDKGTAIRVELFVLLALYSPSRLYLRGGRTRDGRNLEAVDKVMGLSKAAASRYKKNLLAHYGIYKSFRKLVQECYEMCVADVIGRSICENAATDNQ